MRLVHLADLHLGFRQFQRVDARGVNQRESDVAAAFRRIITKTVELDPEVVVVAGDVFHTVRPTNLAIVEAFNGFARLRKALPRATVVIVAGNHDMPRTTETGSILRLFASLGIRVADYSVQRWQPSPDLEVLGVPDHKAIAAAECRPTSDARFRVLVAHGEVVGKIPKGLESVQAIPVDVFPDWSYIALGHYHTHAVIEPHACYSGAIDYTSSDTWAEARSGIPKGLVEYDLAAGAMTFHPVALEREVIDLDPVIATGLTAAGIIAAIDERLGGMAERIDGAIVRLLVLDSPKGIQRDIDTAALRVWRKRALHLQVEFRRALAPKTVREVLDDRTRKVRPSLAEMLADKLASHVLPPDITREEFIAAGQRLLQEVTPNE